MVFYTYNIYIKCCAWTLIIFSTPMPMPSFNLFVGIVDFSKAFKLFKLARSFYFIFYSIFKKMSIFFFFFMKGHHKLGVILELQYTPNLNLKYFSLYRNYN